MDPAIVTVKMLALIIVGLLLTQVSIAVLVGLYRRKRKYREIDLRASEPQAISSSEAVASSVSTPTNPASSWEGFREFRVERRVDEDGNRSICSFYLVPIDGQALPGFRPGQFLTFRLQIEDPVTHQPKTVVRCYSLSDCPRPEYYRVSIKRVPAPSDQPELPPGLSSNFFHDHVQEGTILQVKMPSGHFYLMEDKPLPVVLIGGGIGITPMLSIVETLVQRASQSEIWLYYGARNSGDQIMQERLQEFARNYSNFHLHVCYSRPDHNDVKGIDYQHHSRVDIPLLRATLKFKRYQFYVCGPKQMMEDLVPGLEEWGVHTGDIYYESFGPASLAKPKKTRDEPNKVTAPEITVNFSKTGSKVLWDNNADSLLELAEAHGIEVESGCRAGSCGGCQVALDAGEVEYSQQPDADVEPGHCLLCITTPSSDLTLAA
jgi:uncharacterized protein